MTLNFFIFKYPVINFNYFIYKIYKWQIDRKIIDWIWGGGRFQLKEPQKMRKHEN